MPTNFPGAIDNFTNPTPADDLNTPTVLHSDQHANTNDAVEALEAWIGISGSSVSASIAYRLAQLEMGGFQRNLSANLTLANGMCLVIAEYINLNGNVLDLQGDAALHIA